MTAGLILAAGESRRMGTPKALLPYRNESFLDTLVGLLQDRCAPVIVVLGCAADQIRSAARRAALFVENPHWAAGQTGSMQCGLRSVPPEAAGVLFTLVDHPAVRPQTLDALLRAEPALLRVPRYRGRNGHPIWFSRDLIAEFLALPHSAGARDVVRAHAGETTFLEVDDPGVLADIDDPAAYRALLEDRR